MAAGEVGTVDLSAVRREAHTIKGTSRVMGYMVLGSSAEVLEAVWDEIAAATVYIDPEVGNALEALTAALLDAGRTDPADGTPKLADAVARVIAYVPGIEMLDLPSRPRGDVSQATTIRPR